MGTRLQQQQQQQQRCWQRQREREQQWSASRGRQAGALCQLWSLHQGLEQTGCLCGLGLAGAQSATTFLVILQLSAVTTKVKGSASPSLSGLLGLSYGKTRLTSLNVVGKVQGAVCVVGGGDCST
jgi:hypothetical protein